MRNGNIVWGKMSGYRWWPGMIVSHDYCKSIVEEEGTFCVYWYGHGTVSVLKPSLKTQDFKEKFLTFSKPKGCKKFEAGIIIALRDLRRKCGYGSAIVESKSELMAWALSRFPSSCSAPSEDIKEQTSEHVAYQLKCLSARKESSAACKSEQVSRSKLTWTAEQTSDLACLLCTSSALPALQHHPLFHCSLCESCLIKFKKAYFCTNKRLQSVQCFVCLQPSPDRQFHCSADNCFKMICWYCLQEMASITRLQVTNLPDKFKCPLCSPIEGFNIIKSSWKQNVFTLFHLGSHTCQEKLRRTHVNLFSCNLSVDTSITLLRQCFSNSGATLFICNPSESLSVNDSPQSFTIEKLQSMYNLQYSNLSLACDIIVGSYTESDVDGSVRKYFLTFFSLLGFLRVKKKGDDILWLFEYPSTLSTSFCCVINRFLECESVLCHHRGKRIWTNIPELFNVLNKSSCMS